MIVWNETAACAAIVPQTVARTDLRGLPKNTSARSPIGARARLRVKKDFDTRSGKTERDVHAAALDLEDAS